MSDFERQFAPFERRMQQHGLPQLFINSFAYYYDQLLSGDTGLIFDAAISPVPDLVRMEGLPARLKTIGANALSRTAIIKLNGGLGTSMGLQQAKSLLEVKDGYTFLDVIAGQAIDAGVPLILMDSFATAADSQQALSDHPELASDVPQSFIQHMEPKVSQSTFGPVDWPQDPELTWCPPGHGDIYLSLVTREVLPQLLDQGYQYAFVSNADNLGATLDQRLLGYFVDQELPFMMEVADRTISDRKGGHLAQRISDGRLILRESAQCPPDEQETFQDITRYRYFNTNNLWINLRALDSALRDSNYNLGLPMIRNSKTVDPRDLESTPVFQLETAMGTAVELFERATAVVVPRSRFAPVKKTNDLLVVRSDVYMLNEDCSLTMHPDRHGEPPLVDLDPTYFRLVQDFDQRFPRGVPSLIQCESFRIRGDIRFGQGVVVQGNVIIHNEDDRQLVIEAGAILKG